MGLGFDCFLRSGETPTFLKLAVSRMCNLREDENMSKVMLKASAGVAEGASHLPSLGQGSHLGPGNDADSASN